MSQIDQEQKSKKEALKTLRRERKEWVVKASDTMKTQKKAIKAIKEQLKNNVSTVPLIAQATGISTDEVLWYIAALKKYGKVVEGEKDGAYFRYLPVEDAQEEEANHGVESSMEPSISR